MKTRFSMFYVYESAAKKSAFRNWEVHSYALQGENRELVCAFVWCTCVRTSWPLRV